MNRYAVSALVLLLALSSPALASFGQGNGEIGVGFGITQFDDNTFDETGTGFAVRGGYNITKLFEVEGQLSQVSADVDNALVGDAEVSATTLMVNGVFNFHPRPAIVPYALFGLGTTSVDVDVSGASADDSSAAYQFGGGSRFYFGKDKKMAARVEVSWINEETFNESSTHTNIVGGLTWKLGK
jgi:opacity protein-like surface antigen